MTHRDFLKYHKLLKDIYAYAEHLRDHDASDIATKLEAIIGGAPKKWDDEFIEKLIDEGTKAYDRELAARGSRPRVVGVVVATIDTLSEHECTWDDIDLEGLATDIEDWSVGASEQCDRPGCNLPKGHNQGKADVPSNHSQKND